MTKSWGPYVWQLFHSLAEMIHEDAFVKHRKEIVNIIKQICQTLPCNYCARHAKEYTRRLFPHHLRSKEQLKQYLFDFHNVVNKKTLKSKFTNFEIYKKINLKQVIINFNIIFSKRTSRVSGFTDIITRKKIIKNLNEFMNKNSNDFTPIK